MLKPGYFRVDPSVRLLKEEEAKEGIRFYEREGDIQRHKNAFPKIVKLLYTKIVYTFVFFYFLHKIMGTKEMFERLRRFDAYPKTLEDFRIKTFGGATGIHSSLMAANS